MKKLSDVGFLLLLRGWRDLFMLLNCDSAVSSLSLKTVALGLSQLQIFILSMCLTFVHMAAPEASKRMCLLQSATRLLDDLIGMGEVFC